jgi:hypothetical protein
VTPAETLALSRLLRKCRFAVPETADEGELRAAVVEAARTDDRIEAERHGERYGRDDHGSAGHAGHVLYRIDRRDYGPHGDGPEVCVYYEFEVDDGDWR